MPATARSHAWGGRRKEGRSSLSSSSSTSMGSSSCFLSTILPSFVVGVACFYVGILVATSTTAPTSQTGWWQQQQQGQGNAAELNCQERIQQEIHRVTRELVLPPDPADSLAVGKGDMMMLQAAAAAAAPTDTSRRFPTSMQEFVVGAVAVPRDDFATQFDMGVPLDPSSPTNEQVLVLYSNELSLPQKWMQMKQATASGALPALTVREATQNCDILNVILTDHSGKKGQKRQCMALMGQYESYHLQKWMRMPADSRGKLDTKLPLRFINRGATTGGRKSVHIPTQEATWQYWERLTTYLTSLHEVLAELKPLVAKVAVDQTVVVMVCNFGQSELLLNFLCSATRRGIRLSSVLIFATDEETRDLVRGIYGDSVTVFYDATNYGDLPKQAARRYADNTFASIMMAKIFCVQMITMLGYHVLFQDVDVIWFKDPLIYFQERAHEEWDMYFQDDGNHAMFYAPYSANTGFYYVRANDKTRHFFNSFLMSGDMILSTRSHQIPLVALMAEHVSLFGLRVKIWERNGNDFPGGHAFHRRKDFMKDLFAGRVEPYVFHMSWTLSKNNKLLFYRQMGEWYMHDSCIQEDNTNDIVRALRKEGHDGNDLFQACCSAEPIFSCHYRDKPSLRPCRDSPPIDKGRGSFW